MLNTKSSISNDKEIIGNIKYYTDFNKLIESEINHLEEGIYKENLKLLSEIIQNDDIRVDYIHLKSISIVYNLLSSIKKLKYTNESIIQGVIHNLSHNFLIGEYNYDTKLENTIIEHSIITNEYSLEKVEIRNYKEIVSKILQVLLIKESNTEFIGPIFNSKVYLKTFLDYYSDKVIKTLEEKNIKIKK